MARPSSTVLKGLAALALGVAVYGFSASATGGFRPLDTTTELPPAASAQLRYEGGAPVISGSVAPLFQTAMFAGPNRAEKTDRALPEVNLVAFAGAFDAMRLSIAEARNAAPEDDGPRVSVAAIDPGMIDAEGLHAIDTLTDPALPRPAAVPDALAYGRANTPATDFTPQHNWSEREQWCLATGIYFEARGESYRGQVAVAQVIMNRVEHANYPSTICGVVYQNQNRRNACQFSFACDGIPDRINEPAAWALAQEITQTVLNKEIYLTEIADATHYHATYVRPHWARNMDKVAQVGLHVFYRFKPGWRFG